MQNGVLEWQRMRTAALKYGGILQPWCFSMFICVPRGFVLVAEQIPLFLFAGFAPFVMVSVCQVVSRAGAYLPTCIKFEQSLRAARQAGGTACGKL